MPVKKLAALLLCLIIAGTGAYLIQAQPDVIVYAAQMPSSAEKLSENGRKAEDSDLLLALKKLEKDMKSGQWPAWSLNGIKEGAALFSDRGDSVNARLCGLYGSLLAGGEWLVRFGRMLYPEEVQSGARVAVIDEGLAIKLFFSGDAVGRRLTIGQESFQVVGVLRAARMPGDRDAFSAYVPLCALEKQAYQTDIGIVTANGGTMSALQKAAEGALPGGTAQDLKKEKYRAMLPARLCGAAAGFAILLWLARLLLGVGKRRAAALKARARMEYVRRLMPRAIMEGLLGALCLAAMAAGVYMLLTAAIEPLYVFPEWVPAVPVEPAEIIKTFWTLRANESALIEYRSPELLSLRFLRGVMTVGCVPAMLLIFSLIPKKQKTRDVQDGTAQ